MLEKKNKSKKQDFRCDICKDSTCNVLHPTKKGWICIHCHWKYKIKISELKEVPKLDDFKAPQWWKDE